LPHHLTTLANKGHSQYIEKEWLKQNYCPLFAVEEQSINNLKNALFKSKKMSIFVPMQSFNSALKMS
jgi:hypothetical protein